MKSASLGRALCMRTKNGLESQPLARVSTYSKNERKWVCREQHRVRERAGGRAAMLTPPSPAEEG